MSFKVGDKVKVGVKIGTLPVEDGDEGVVSDYYAFLFPYHVTFSDGRTFAFKASELKKSGVGDKDVAG